MTRKLFLTVLAISGAVHHPVFAQHDYMPPGAYPMQRSTGTPFTGNDLTNLYGGYPYEAPLLNERARRPNPYNRQAPTGYYPRPDAGQYGYAPVPGYGDSYGRPDFRDQYGYYSGNQAPPYYRDSLPPGYAERENDRLEFRPTEMDYLRYLRESMARSYGAWGGGPASAASHAYPAYPVDRDYPVPYGTHQPGRYPPVPGPWPAPMYGAPTWPYAFDDEYVPPPPGDDAVYGEYPAGPSFEAWPGWQAPDAEQAVVPPPGQLPTPAAPAMDTPPEAQPPMPPFPNQQPYIMPPVTDFDSEPPGPPTNQPLPTDPALPTADSEPKTAVPAMPPFPDRQPYIMPPATDGGPEPARPATKEPVPAEPVLPTAN